MDVERRLLSKVLREKDLQTCLDAKIQASYFENDQYAGLWTWICNYYSEYGEVPTAAVLRRDHPWFKLTTDVSEPMEWYTSQLLAAREYALLHDAVVEAGVHLKAQDAEKARHVVQACMGVLASEISKMRDENLADPLVLEAWETDYEEREKLDGRLRGLPTGFPTIDRASSGLQPQQLIVLGGPPKAGKSMSLIIMAKTIHEHGHVPLFIGFEMSNEEQRYRYAAVAARVKYQSLLDGKLTPMEKKRFKRALHALDGSADFWLVSDPSATATITGIRSKIDTHHPAVVLIDGLYLMQDEMSGESNTALALTNITRSLKRMSQQYKIPIVGTTQVLEWKMSKKRGVTAHSFGYSSSFAQDADVLLGLERTDEDDVKKLKVVEARHMRNVEAYLSWNWETGEFEEMDGGITAEDTDDTT